MAKGLTVNICLMALVFSVGLRISGAKPTNATVGKQPVDVKIPVKAVVQSNATSSVSNATTSVPPSVAESDDVEPVCPFLNCKCNGEEAAMPTFEDITCKNQSAPLSRNPNVTTRSRIILLDLSSSGLTQLSEGLFANLDINDIDLSDNNFTSLHPNAFKGIVKLLGLDMSRNQLSDLDEDFFKPISNVTDLKLNLNQLNKMNSSKLERILNSFVHLSILHLRSNNLQQMPSLASLTEITALHLESNQLKTLLGPSGEHCIPNSVLDLILENNQIVRIDNKTFSNLINLKYLDLSSNQISYIAPDAFSSLRKLRQLILKKNYLKQIPSHVVFSLVNLEILDLANQNAVFKHIDDYAFDRIPNGSALRVDLSGNKIVSIGAKAFCVRNNESPYANIQKLDLGGHHFTEFKACLAIQLKRGLSNSTPVVLFKSANSQLMQPEINLKCDCEVTHSAYFVSMTGECNGNNQLPSYTCTNGLSNDQVIALCRHTEFDCPTNHTAIPVQHFQPHEEHPDTGYTADLNKSSDDADLEHVEHGGTNLTVGLKSHKTSNTDSSSSSAHSQIRLNGLVITLASLIVLALGLF